MGRDRREARRSAPPRLGATADDRVPRSRGGSGCGDRVVAARRAASAALERAPRGVVRVCCGASPWCSPRVHHGPGGLTEPLTGRFEYLGQVGAVGSPGSFLAGFADAVRARTYSVHVHGHPPGFLLVLWLLDRIGLGGAVPGRRTGDRGRRRCRAVRARRRAQRRLRRGRSTGVAVPRGRTGGRVGGHERRRALPGGRRGRVHRRRGGDRSARWTRRPPRRLRWDRLRGRGVPVLRARARGGHPVRRRRRPPAGAAAGAGRGRARSWCSERSRCSASPGSTASPRPGSATSPESRRSARIRRS